MSSKSERKGRCLCGAIEITAPSASNSIGACHCEMCRRWSGGPFMEIDCGPNVVFSGEEHISVFASSDWAERGFCKNCGTHLFYRIKESGEHMMPVGLFDQDDDLTFSLQVFIEEKPAYYRFADETKNMTGEEIFAAYSPPE